MVPVELMTPLVMPIAERPLPAVTAVTEPAPEAPHTGTPELPVVTTCPVVPMESAAQEPAAR